MRAFAFLILISILGCASTGHRPFDKVRVGQDKAEVLETLGNPTRTFREHGQDHWIYVYFKKNQEWQRQVIFEDGKVLSVTKPVTPSELERALKNSKTIEEFETKARNHQEKNRGKFKKIDGGSDDPSQP